MEYENILLLPELLISGDNDLCATQFLRPLMSGSVPVEIFLLLPSPAMDSLLSVFVRLTCYAKPVLTDGNLH